MRNARHLYRYVLTGGALVALSCAPSGAWAQQSGSQEQAQVQAQETSQTDLAAFDDFLDANQGIATQLIANPALASNKDFLNNHPQLQDFLNDHPKIQQQITSNPDAFMDGLAKFEHSRQDRADDRGNSPNRGNNGNQNPDLTRREVASMDQFLDSHQDIERQLEQNPSLINDQTFLQNHPGLQSFLKDHPQIQAEFAENPQFFILRMNRNENSPADQRADNDVNRTNNRNQNPDLTRREVASMDQFLDSHEDIERQLQANPSLIKDQTFLQNHPVLQTFLNEHPNIQAEFAENPQFFMLRTNRFENSPADQRADNNRMNNTNANANNNTNTSTANERNENQNQNPDLNRREVASMDQFLDSHQDIERQLEDNPSLINDQTFLNNHPQLQSFLKDHPQIHAEFTENPQFFILRMNRNENSPADQRADNDVNRTNNRNQNPDLTRREVASMDQFLDSHEDIERQLEQNPSLISNQTFLQNHPQLQTFLTNHPQIQAEFAENPQFFMLRTNRFENSPADQRADNNQMNNGNNNPNNPNTANEGNRNPDLNRGEVASMDQFLDSHDRIERELKANPSLINNVDYLKKHQDLRAFLSSHPAVREEFTENPSLFMNREGQYERTEFRGGTDMNQRDVATLDQYLDKHAGEARDLQAYPARVNDSDYLEHHKDLDSFLKKHPQVREEFTENPREFMGAESAFEANSEMDEFLDAHKKVAKDLDENPGRVKDNDYLKHHKDLDSFLDKNPGVKDQFMGDPDAFMRSERRFDADREMDVYLTKHRNVAKDLDKDPDRVKDDKYLDHHKDLKELLDKHPDMEQKARMNPSEFMKERAKFHQDFQNHKMHEKTKVEQRATTHSH